MVCYERFAQAWMITGSQAVELVKENSLKRAGGGIYEMVDTGEQLGLCTFLKRFIKTGDLARHEKLYTGGKLNM